VPGLPFYRSRKRPGYTREKERRKEKKKEKKQRRRKP
jgi:hypothetical protein